MTEIDTKLGMVEWTADGEKGNSLDHGKGGSESISGGIRSLGYWNHRSFRKLETVAWDNNFVIPCLIYEVCSH